MKTTKRGRNKRDKKREMDGEYLMKDSPLRGLSSVEFGSIETLAAAMEVGIETTTETFVPVLVYSWIEASTTMAKDHSTINPRNCTRSNPL